MQKVGTVTETADSNGEFTNGNVAQGIPPTILKAEIFNTWQRELANVVISSELTLDPNDDGQVLKAINKLISLAAAVASVNGKKGEVIIKPSDIGLGNVGDFNAVQQGGVGNQSKSKVYIGWGNDGILRCTVDSTDLGQIFTTKSPPNATETGAFPITGGNLRGSLNALGGVGTQGGAFFIRNSDGVQVASISANSNGSISVYSDVTGSSFGIGSDGGFFTSSGVEISESGQRVYSPNNPPPSQTDKSVSGDGWWYRDSRTGIIFQGGFISGSTSESGAIDRIPLNIAVPNRLLHVSTIIRNFAQGFQTTWNPQTRNLSGERTGFDWIHGNQEREVYWMAIGY